MAQMLALRGAEPKCCFYHLRTQLRELGVALMTTVEPCPCGSDTSYAECCEPFHKEESLAPDAKTLMRSRYSAYVLGNIDYLAKTIPMLQRKSFDRRSAKEWSQGSEWLGLEILSTTAGEAQDSTGTVEFKARFKREGIEYCHHERAYFKKTGKRWLFIDGKILSDEGEPEEEVQISRNAACPCGSGKKYKRCCAEK